MYKINNFLNHVYGSNQSLLYFYIALGAIALFFIILILIILLTAENASRKRYLKKQQLKEQENKDQIIIEDKKIENNKKEPEKVPIKNDKSLSETQVFNNILMSKEELIEKPKEKDKEVDLILKERKHHEEKINALKKEKIEPIILDQDFYIEKDTFNKKEDVVLEEKEEIKPKENKSELPKKDIKDKNIIEDFTIEIPKVKPMDIDDYLFRREKETEISNTPNNSIQKEENKKEQTKKENIKVEPEPKLDIKPEIVKNEPEKTIKKPEEPVKVELSNDELKNRLAKLRTKKENKKELLDSDLEDLMKAVGLEDTTIIPKLKDEEKQVLGR